MCGFLGFAGGGGGAVGAAGGAADCAACVACAGPLQYRHPSWARAWVQQSSIKEDGGGSNDRDVRV